jgi:hypothetical protein
MEFSADLAGTILGSFLGGFICYNLVKFILFRFLEEKTVIFVSFIGSSILVLVITSFTMGFVPGFIRYIPAIFVWFVVDLIKLNKRKKSSQHYDSDSLHSS